MRAALYAAAKLSECGIFSDATISGCYTSSSRGIWFWTAGHRVMHANSAFVWNVTSTDTSSGVVSDMNYTNWDSTEPDNFGNVCIYLRGTRNYRWADYSCTAERCSVCELDV